MIANAFPPCLAHGGLRQMMITRIVTTAMTATASPTATVWRTYTKLGLLTQILLFLARVFFSFFPCHMAKPPSKQAHSELFAFLIMHL